jgi:chromosomal replication initiation ATPase DnaA
MTRQLAFEFPHRPAFGAADFLVAPNNEIAVSWLDRWPAWPGPALLLHGPPGCGKTHLAHVWQAHAGAIYRSAADLSAADVPGLADSAALVLDDAERAAERPLLHLFNLVGERRGHLLMTAALPPSRWAIALPDLRSRLLAIPTIAVLPPDEGLIGAILVKLFADRQILVAEDVLTYLLSRIDRSFAAARDVVERLDRAALAAARRITVPLARQVLEREADGD